MKCNITYVCLRLRVRTFRSVWNSVLQPVPFLKFFKAHGVEGVESRRVRNTVPWQVDEGGVSVVPTRTMTMPCASVIPSMQRWLCITISFCFVCWVGLTDRRSMEHVTVGLQSMPCFSTCCIHNGRRLLSNYAFAPSCIPLQNACVLKFRQT